MKKKDFQAYKDNQIGQPVNGDAKLLQMLWDWSGIKDIEGWDVIEVGCGNGAFLDILSKLKPKSLVGVDINPMFSNRDNVITGMQEELGCEDNSFDLYISSETLEHSYDHKKAIAEMYRILRPGGMALIGLPWGKQHSEEKVHHSAIPLGLTETVDEVKKQFKNPKFESFKGEVINNIAFEELRILIVTKD